MNCPRCGEPSESTGKKWKYGSFDVEQQRCDGCAKMFNAYYKDGKLSYTVPKAEH
jgi:hypothetical protein